jgi:hypothetical protein
VAVPWQEVGAHVRRLLVAVEGVLVPLDEGVVVAQLLVARERRGHLLELEDRVRECALLLRAQVLGGFADERLLAVAPTASAVRPAGRKRPAEREGECCQDGADHAMRLDRPPEVWGLDTKGSWRQAFEWAILSA